MKSLAEGTIDFYRTYRPLSRTRTHRRGVYVWSHAIDIGEHRYALTQIRAAEGPTQSPLVESLGYEPTKFAIGILDKFGIVTSVSNDLEEVIGVPADDFIGRHLLPEDQHAFWSRFHSAPPSPSGCAASLPYRSTTTDPLATNVQCLLVCLAGSDSACFILSQQPPQYVLAESDRTAELEQRLLRIAHEVQASGVIGAMGSIPDPTRFPQLRSLSSKQWDALTRLLRGDRVPAIAEEMFMSQSAVRNHLSEVFRRFDVHSQSELLALLRP